MNTTVIQCDGCEEYIALNNDTNGIFHDLELNFKTSITDHHTGIVEEVPTMRRNTKAVYCEKCFNKLVDKLESFLEEVGPKYRNVSQPSIAGKPGEISEAAIASKKSTNNFKAKNGTVLLSEKKGTNSVS